MLEMEQENGIVLVENPASVIEKLQGSTGFATMGMNTYTRRYLKVIKEGEVRNDKALVVWVNGVEKGGICSDAAQIEEEEGHYYDFAYDEEIANGKMRDIRSPPSSWALQKILELSKMVGMSCDGYENRLLQLFDELEASRG